MTSQKHSMFQLTGCVSQLVVATVLVLDSSNMCTWQGDGRRKRGEERRGEERRGEEMRGEERRGEEAEEKARRREDTSDGPHSRVK